MSHILILETTNLPNRSPIVDTKKYSQYRRIWEPSTVVMSKGFRGSTFVV